MTPPAIEIRPIGPGEQEPARALVLAGLEEHWGTLDLNRNPDLADIADCYKDGVFLVAIIDGELIGTGALLPEGPQTGRIVRMSVARSRRRQGIGQRILAALLDEARQAGHSLVVLETTADWKEAVSFYHRNGFRSVDVRDGDIHFAMNLEVGPDDGRE